MVQSRLRQPPLLDHVHMLGLCTKKLLPLVTFGIRDPLCKLSTGRAPAPQKQQARHEYFAISQPPRMLARLPESQLLIPGSQAASKAGATGPFFCWHIMRVTPAQVLGFESIEGHPIEI